MKRPPSTVGSDSGSAMAGERTEDGHFTLRLAVPETPAKLAPMTEAPPPPETPIGRLLNVMARLRDPKSGCPWDIEQTFATIAPYTIEEAYERSEERRVGKECVSEW